VSLAACLQAIPLAHSIRSSHTSLVRSYARTGTVRGPRRPHTPLHPGPTKGMVEHATSIKIFKKENKITMAVSTEATGKSKAKYYLTPHPFGWFCSATPKNRGRGDWYTTTCKLPKIASSSSRSSIGWKE